MTNGYISRDFYIKPCGLLPLVYVTRCVPGDMLQWRILSSQRHQTETHPTNLSLGLFFHPFYRPRKILV